jgi:transcriptional regulator with XRE-family HTH domain
MKNIGSRIAAFREEKGLSLSKLADLSGVSKGILHRLENDEHANPEFATLQRVARALKITVGDLLDREVVQNTRLLPDEAPRWLSSLTAQLRAIGKEPDPAYLEALYVLQNRKGQSKTKDEDWLFLYQSIERSFSR